MEPNRLRRLTAAIFTSVAVLALVPSPAHAGPELLCWPFDIGAAESLPMGSGGWRAIPPGYDTSRVVDDTLRLLTPEAPVLVRMETLRRAVVYASKNSGIASNLLSRLQERVKASERSGKPDALALFDLGYFIEARRQGSFMWGVLATLQGLDGHQLAERALALRGPDPQMEFGAALLAHVRDRETASQEHLRKAVAGAETDRLLATNLVTHAHLVRMPAGELAALKERYGSGNGQK